jgi:sugar phosphate isomerase/epimerase
MDRRTFVHSVGALAAASALPEVPRLARREKLDKIGVQLYTVRAAMQVSVERTLDEVAGIGFKEVEFAGYFNRPPRALRQLLDRNGLVAPAAHIGLDDLRGAWNRRLADAAEIGHKWLVVASLNDSDRNSIDALKRTADILNRSAEDAKLYKIKLGYHNHEIEFQDVEGQRMFDVLLDHTDPDKVQFEMDLYWITKGGGDPLHYFEKYPGRFPMVHVKDAGPPPQYAMRDVGKGQINFAAIFAHHKEAGIKHYFVEHDSPANPMVSIRNSYNYLKDLRF